MHKKIGNLPALKRALESVSDRKGANSDEFTVNEFIRFCAESGIKIKSRSAMDRLNKLVESGELSRRMVIVNGSRTNVYSEKK